MAEKPHLEKSSQRDFVTEMMTVEDACKGSKLKYFAEVGL